MSKVQPLALRPILFVQSGVALLTVLFVLVLLTTLAVFMAEDENLAIRKAENQRDAEQSKQVALAGEMLAAKLLEQDVTTSPICGANVDCLNDIWNIDGPMIGITDAPTSVKVYDESAKFNLNNLVDGRLIAGIPSATASSTPPTVSIWYSAFETLLDSRSPAIPSVYADVVVDWVDANQITGPDGAEDTDYTAVSDEPYLAANNWMKTISEFSFLSSFTDDQKRSLLPYLTALPVTPGPPVPSINPPVAQNLGTLTPININTASDVVLHSLGVTSAGLDAILFQQQNGGYTSLSTVSSVYFNDWSVAQTMLDVESAYFSVESCAQFGRAVHGLRSVLWRRPGSGNTTVVQTLSREPHYNCF